MSERKRNRFGSPGLRLMQLYILLASRGSACSLTRLSNLLDCSRQTILRMVEQINLIPDVECETWIERNERYFRISAKPAGTNMALSPEALKYLVLCRDIVGHLLPKTFKEELNKTLGTGAAGTASPGMAEPWVKGQIDYTSCQDTLEDMQTAMQEKRLCRIAYLSRSSGKQISYFAAPLYIIAYREALYLRCRVYTVPDKPTDKFLTLAIHRIKTFRLSAEHFTETGDNDRDPNFGFPFHEPIQVKVAFWGGAATYVGERTWSKGQRLRKRKDGATILTFTTTSRLEVLSWVLGFGPDAELLEPKDLREEIKDRAKGIVGRYQPSESATPVHGDNVKKRTP